MGELRASYHDIPSLTAAEHERMFALFGQYYDAVSESQFERDLSGKTKAILLEDARGKIQGFSTLEVIPFEMDCRQAIALYSGDTIISHRHWGEQQLAHAWCFLAGQIKRLHPRLPLYWFLIVKGHRTYRYLPAFTRRFYPSFNEDTPKTVQAVMNKLATDKFGNAYCAETGVLHFPGSRGHLRHEWSKPSEALMKKPAVEFFVRKNPGYAFGDELVCLTELCESNMRSISRTAFLEGFNSAGME